MLVAASLPPACGAYAPGAFRGDTAARVLRVLVRAQAPFADLWLAETLGGTAEARAAADALRAEGARDARPLWLSFTLAQPAGDDAAAEPALLSGERVADAVRVALELRAAALLFNCAPPELMLDALGAAAAALEAAAAGATGGAPGAAMRPGAPGAMRLGVYANAFAEAPAADKPANAALLALRPELTPRAYASLAARWVARGASVVGGCCGLGPAHIAALRDALQPGGGG